MEGRQAIRQLPVGAGDGQGLPGTDRGCRGGGEALMGLAGTATCRECAQRDTEKVLARSHL